MSAVGGLQLQTDDQKTLISLHPSHFADVSLVDRVNYLRMDFVIVVVQLVFGEGEAFEDEQLRQVDDDRGVRGRDQLRIDHPFAGDWYAEWS